MRALKKSLPIVVCLGLSASFALPAVASIKVLDFDYDSYGNKIGNGQVIDDEYKGYGVSISSCKLRNFGTPASGTNTRDGICNEVKSNGDRWVQGEFQGVTYDTENLSGRGRNDMGFEVRDRKDANGNVLFQLNPDGSPRLDSNGDPITQKEWVTLGGVDGQSFDTYTQPWVGNLGLSKDDYIDFFRQRRADVGSVDAGNYWSPGNVLIFNRNPNECDFDFATQRSEFCGLPGQGPIEEDDQGQGFFVFEFDEPVDILNIDFLDFQNPQTNRSGDNGSIFFHTASGGLIEESVPVVGDAMYMNQAYFNKESITKLVINFPDSGGIKNLVFQASGNTPPGGPTPVNAPSMAMLLLLSVGTMFLRRRRK